MFKVDDGFYDHPKVRSIPRGNPRKGAIALWTLAGSWCDRYLTDGLVPAHQVEEFGASDKDADWLTASGLWHGSGHDCDCPEVPPKHYLYHDWTQCNELKVDVEKRRSKARERMRKLRNGDATTASNVHPLSPGSSRERAEER